MTGSFSIMDLIRKRFIQAIMLSSFFLQFGVWIRNFAILLFVVEQTNGDAFAVSMISVAEFLPIFIFSFVGGALADRWKPKRTMVWCDLLSAVSILFVLLALVFGTWKAIFLATLASSILSQFSQPSGMKLFKHHVPAEQMQTGMSMYQTLFAIFMILGPVLGTSVYQRFGIYTSIGIMGISFLMSAAALLFLPEDGDRKEAKAESDLFGEMVQGLKYILSKKILLILGGSFAMAGLGVGLVVPLGVFVVTERLGLPKEYFQWISIAKGVGMIIGGVLTVAASRTLTPKLLLIAGFAVNGVCLMLAGSSTMFWLTFAAEFFIGFITPAFQVAVQTLILKNTDEAFVGRVNGILTPLFMGAMVLTMSGAGWLKHMTSVFFMYELAGGMFIISTLLSILLYRMPVDTDQPAAGHNVQDQSTTTAH